MQNIYRNNDHALFSNNSCLKLQHFLTSRIPHNLFQIHTLNVHTTNKIRSSDGTIVYQHLVNDTEYTSTQTK